MNSKERMLVALARGKPDRLPVSIHQWQQFHLDTVMGGMSELAAFKATGLDAQIQYFGDAGQIAWADSAYNTEPRLNTPQWRDEATVVSDQPERRIIHHTIHTPEGTLTFKTESNRKTVWTTEYLIKRDEDISLIRKYMPIPRPDLAKISAAYDAVGDAGILRGFVWGEQAGCWQNAACFMDTTQLIYATVDKPGWVHDLLGILLEKKLRYIETMKGARFDLVETGGGAGSSTVISPRIFREFCQPYDRKMHDALHSLGFKVTYHTCGGNRGIEDLIVETGADASETMAPISVGGNQEPWEFKQKIGGRLAVIGGIDQFNVLTTGPVSLIKEKVHEAFEKIGADGGYICAASDHFFDAPLEHLRALADAGRECVY